MSPPHPNETGEERAPPNAAIWTRSRFITSFEFFGPLAQLVRAEDS